MTQFNNFINGLETDISPDLVKPGKYIDGENFRITIGDNESLIINNGKGPKKLLWFNTHKIIGIVNIKEYVVLFCKSNSSNGFNYIYKIRLFHPKISSLMQLDNKLIDFNNLSVGSIILKSTKIEFGEQISYVYNIENENLYQLYFTNSDISDSPIYRINILESYENVDDDLSKILLFNNTILKTPTILEIKDGNLKCGTYRYAYQVFELNGSETIYSGLTNPVFLTSTSYSTSYSSFFGNLSTDDTSNKSISFKIEGIKDKYCRIVRLYYTDAINFPTCYVVFEGKVTSNDFIFTDTSFNNIIGTSSIDEISLGFIPLKAKHLETKNNFLFFGNVTEEYFDININTRAYRWNLPGTEIKLVNPDSTTVTISRNQYEAFCTDQSFITNYEDCYCPYNIPIETDHNYSNLYKYNLDGVLGGHGPHVSFSFITKEIKVTDSFNYTWSVKNYLFLNNSFTPSTNSPLTAPIGYQRDEIYRFGVIFFNEKGQRTPVKWIEDIRFPKPFENPALLKFYNGDISQPTYANVIGIKFRFRNLPPEVKALQIVRALRTKENGTIIDAGILSTYKYSNTDGYYYLPNGSYCNNPNVPFYLAYSNGPEYNSNSVSLLFDYISPELKYSTEYRNLGSHIFLNGHTSKLGKQVVHDSKVGADGESGYGPVVLHLKFLSNYVSITSPITYKHFYESTKTTDNTVDLPGNIRMRTKTGEKDKNEKYYRRGYRYSSLVLKLNNSYITNSSDPIYAYRKQNIYPYGGFSKIARENTKYIPCSDVISVSSSTTDVEVFQGDTFVGIFEYMYATADANIPEKLRQPILIQAIVESRINLWYTSDNKISKKFPNTIYSYEKRIDPFDEKSDVFDIWTTQEESGVYDVNTSKTKKYVQGSNLYEYNGVYSAIDPKIYYYQKSSLQSNTTSFPVRIVKSPKKFNNALSDTWSRVNPSDYLDLEIKYGDLINLISTNSGLITFQNKGIAIIPVEERSVVRDTNENELITGRSKALDRFDYINTTYGITKSKHVQKTPNAVYFIDTNNKIIGKITNQIEIISKMKGVQNLLNKFDLTSSNICIIPNNKYNEVWFCLGEKTLLFSEINNMFISKLDSFFSNGIDIYNNSFGITHFNTSSVLYLLDNGDYGKYKIDSSGNLKLSDFILEFVINPNNGTLNRLDSILVNGIAEQNNELFNILQVKNNYQDTGEFSVSPELRFRSWRINNIRDTENNRLIDYYNIVKFKYIPPETINSYKVLIKGVFSENVPIFNR